MDLSDKPKIASDALGNRGIKPERTLWLDDDLKTLEIAKQLGFYTVLRRVHGRGYVSGVEEYSDIEADDDLTDVGVMILEQNEKCRLVVNQDKKT